MNTIDQKAAWADWLTSKQFNVVGTLKYTDGESISDRSAEGILRKFFNSLDILYFGSNRVESGHRINRVVFRQLGISGSNLHFHFLAQSPADPHHFCDIARWEWANASRFTIGYSDVDIAPLRNKRAAAQYGLHEYWRLGGDTIHLPTSHLCGQHPSVRPLSRMRRLLKQSERNTRSFELLTEPRWLHRHLDSLRQADDVELIAGPSATH